MIKVKVVCVSLLLAVSSFAAPTVKTADVIVVNTLNGGHITFGDMITHPDVGNMLVGDIVARVTAARDDDDNPLNIKGYDTMLNQIAAIKKQHPKLYSMKLSVAVKLPWNGSVNIK